MKCRIAVILMVILLSTRANAISISPDDTSAVFRQIRSGMKYLDDKPMLLQAKICIDSAVRLCERQKIEQPSMLLLLRANYAFYSGDYSGASDLASMALNKSESDGDYHAQALTLIFFGGFYSRTRAYQESLDYYEKGISLAKKKGIKGILPEAILAQALVYRTIEQYEDCEAYLYRMLEAARIEKDTTSISKGLFFLGTLYAERMRNFELSDSILRECYRISSIKDDYSNMALAQANLGWNFYLGKIYDSSAACYERALKIALPVKNYTLAANAYGNLGNIYRDLKLSNKALDHYKKSIDLASESEDLYNLQWVYQDLSNLYLRQGDTSNAYLTFVKHKKYSDAYRARSNVEGLTDAKIQYEAENHRKEVELLSLKLKNQKLALYGYATLSLLLLSILLLLFRGSRLKAKRRISEMNRTISELTQVNLRQQMNPHFIFNTLNSIQYYMYQQDKLATNTYLTKFTSLMRKVLENSQHTSVTISDELEALKLYLELERLRFKDRFDYVINVDEEIDPLLFRIPTMLIQPYVENSICHGMIPAGTKGMLRIDLKLEKEHITCTIKDNGIGREAARERKKSQGNNHNSLGTRIATSRLDLVNTLYGTNLTTIYTDLKNNKGEPAGTMVEINIPIML